MEFQKLAETRRSIRKYNAVPVTREQILELIQAARLAPSWKNSQTARYYCVMTEEMKKKFREQCLPPFNAKNCADAGALIVTAFVKNRAGFSRDGSADNELGNGWGAYDLGLADQTLVLKAKDLGLGTLIMGIRDEKKIREFLEIPEDQVIVSVISVGYTEDEPEPPKRKPAEDITVFV